MSADVEWRELARRLICNGYIDVAGAAELDRLHRKACRQEARVRRLAAERELVHSIQMPHPMNPSSDAMFWSPEESDEAAHPAHP